MEVEISQVEKTCRLLDNNYSLLFLDYQLKTGWFDPLDASLIPGLDDKDSLSLLLEVFVVFQNSL